MARTIHALPLAAVLVTVAAPSVAADPSAAECLGANEKAISLRNDHKLRAARAQLVICAASSCPVDVRNECVRRVAEVNTAIPTIVFEVKDAAGRDLSAVKVSMDGQPLVDQLDGTALSIDPGKHTFTFDAAGQPTIDKLLVIREGQKGRREAVTFGGPAAAAPTPASISTQSAPVIAPQTETISTQAGGRSGGLSGQKVGALVAGGVGVAGIAVGSIFGLSAISKKNDAATYCDPGCRDQSWLDLKASSMHAGNISTVAFVVGGVGLAGAALLWLTDPSDKSAAPRVGIAPSGIVVKGAW
jgi:hypothetical protein